MFCWIIIDAARLSVGGLLLTIDRVLSGVVRNGLAVIRPPGHHAGDASARGFCLVNNVAIAGIFILLYSFFVLSFVF